MTTTSATRRVAFLCAAAVLLTGRVSQASPLTLAAKPDPAVLNAVRMAASRGAGPGARLTDPSLFAGQSFRIVSNGRDMGALVSGRGILPARAADANPVTACFAALKPVGATPQLVVTIGAGDWEAESCNGVTAVGLLPDAGGRSRAAFVYKTTAPHESPVEPVVVSWSDGTPLAVDAQASKRASLAGAETVQQVRAALK